MSKFFKKVGERILKPAKFADGTVCDGVKFFTFATGEKMMPTSMIYKSGAKVPPHSHPHEQVGVVISGKFEMRIGEEKMKLESGDSYFVPGDVEHEIAALSDGEIFDTFSPPRDEYRD